MMGLLLLLAPLLGTAIAAPGSVPVTLRETVCQLRAPAPSGDDFALVALPGPHQVNETGVVLLVNCTGRTILSLRDPHRSNRHVREQLYDPLRRVRLRHDPNSYGALNFNQEVHQASFQHTIFARDQGWTGLCIYNGLELVTAGGHGLTDTYSITFSIDICKNQLLALVPPAR